MMALGFRSQSSEGYHPLRWDTVIDMRGLNVCKMQRFWTVTLFGKAYTRKLDAITHNEGKRETKFDRVCAFHRPIIGKTFEVLCRIYAITTSQQ
jgi:hypothetical protein